MKIEDLNYENNKEKINDLALRLDILGLNIDNLIYDINCSLEDANRLYKKYQLKYQ